MPLIILRSLLILATVLLASCAAVEKEINVSGSPFGRAPTAKLLVPSHLVVKKVNGVEVNMPLLSNGNVTLLIAEGDSEVEVYFDHIYEDNHTDNYERINSDSFYAVITEAKKGQVYNFDLQLPDRQEEAQALVETSLGKIVCKDDGRSFTLTKDRQGKKGLRDYINDNDPYKQLQHWWKKADSKQKARFKRDILSE